MKMKNFFLAWFKGFELNLPLFTMVFEKPLDRSNGSAIPVNANER